MQFEYNNRLQGVRASGRQEFGRNYFLIFDTVCAR